MKQHNYETTITWTGNNGTGTSDYRAYERSHTLTVNGKPDMLCSSDTPFRGDAAKHNPEDMLLASLSSCHMLWYLHLCADAGIVVTDYTDNAKGVMTETPGSGGKFTEVTLYPVVTITDDRRADEANQLHDKAHKFCFIANSVNFPVKHEAVCKMRNK
ncbi:MAG: OsmC family protein [Bacteroidota bacterium]